MKELTKIIYNGAIYIPLRELTKVFVEESLYTIKKSIKEQDIKTSTLEGFGRSLFILEDDINNLIVNGKSVLLSTKVTTLSDEAKMVSLLSLFTGDNELTKQMQENKIKEFISKPEHTVKTISKENKKEHIEFNKGMEDLGLGYRLVNIDMKNNNLGCNGAVRETLTCLIDKDMNIIGKPFDTSFEVADNKLYIECNDICIGDLEDYNYILPLDYSNVLIDRNKIISNLINLVFNGETRLTESNGWFECIEGKFDLKEEQLILLMNKNTMITDIEIVA